MRILALVALLISLPAAANAAVQLHFYSRDFGIRYPHAFIVLTGTVDSTGEVVDANYGFTATNTSPVAAFRAVNGRIAVVDQGFINRSNDHFVLTLTDQQYALVMNTVAAWENAEQPSYHVNRANCVFFVADIAKALGLEAEPIEGLMLRPKRYLEAIFEINEPVIASWNSPAGQLANSDNAVLATD